MNKAWLTKKNILIAGAVLVIVILGVVVAQRDTNQNQEQSSNNTPAKTKIDPSGIQYPAGWHESQEINTNDKNAGVTSEASRSNPSARVIVREVIGQLEADFDIQKLPEQVSSSLSQGLEGYELIDKKVTKLGQYDAVQINYRAQSEDDEKVKVNEMFIIPTAHKTFYITYRIDGADITEIEKDITDINKSVVNYIKDRTKD